jgi:hypothetical protein
MAHSFSVGERVRVGLFSRCAMARPGDVGTVMWVSWDWAGDGVLFYHVRLDGPERGYASLYPHEVESAAEAGVCLQESCAEG